VVRRGNAVRLTIALSVAATLAVFLVYTALAGGGTPSIQPSALGKHRGEVNLEGVVVGPVRGDAHASGLRFALRDLTGRASVPVVYKGSVPDLFKVGRRVFLGGALHHGTFVGKRDSLVTKCPSKYKSKG
jgi:cytochrome c-type biogenesis protein CcmE